MDDDLLELLLALANFDMDDEDCVSFILSGTHKLAARIRLGASLNSGEMHHFWTGTN